MQYSKRDKVLVDRWVLSLDQQGNLEQLCPLNGCCPQQEERNSGWKERLEGTAQKKSRDAIQKEKRGGQGGVQQELDDPQSNCDSLQNKVINKKDSDGSAFLGNVLYTKKGAEVRVRFATHRDVLVSE